jgi:hypothetical protein
MALGLVLVGIAAGLLAAGGVLVLGGGAGLAVLAYLGGGLAGMMGGLASAFLPRHRVAVIASHDHS